jgi:hypothetical protein
VDAILNHGSHPHEEYPLTDDFAQAPGLDSRYVGTWDQVGAQQLSQGVRVDGVGLDLGRGDCPHPERVRQLNLRDVVDGFQRFIDTFEHSWPLMEGWLAAEPNLAARELLTRLMQL